MEEEEVEEEEEEEEVMMQYLSQAFPFDWCEVMETLSLSLSLSLSRAVLPFHFLSPSSCQILSVCLSV